MIASALHLNRADIKALKITDPYSIHRVIYDLFDDVRTEDEKNASVPSGILYADKGGDWDTRQILILSDRSPKTPKHGQVKTKTIEDGFLQFDQYGFEVTVNPSKRLKDTKKNISVRGREEVIDWFVGRSKTSWGFEVDKESLQLLNLGVQSFKKGTHTVTHGSASLKGVLQVIDRDRFLQSFKRGIGKGRAFGFGLLQIVPLINTFDI